MRQTWYSGGVPEYQADREYDLDRPLAERLIRRGAAAMVHIARPETQEALPDGRTIPVTIRGQGDDAPARKSVRKRRSAK